ncbi:MAG: penicillin-binding protein activator, partial [Myxococcales bacterium]|nr:penicillin-binding protein activator [Myxococcales bacterium]
SVSAIVGPLLASEAEGAAATADARRIPLLTLTGRDNVARTRPHVFRVGREPRGEIQVLVDHAMSKAGLGRFAILYPDDAYGRGARDLFWDEVEARGGRVVGVEAYEPEATDFAKPIRRMIGFSFLSDAQKEALDAREEMLDQAKRLPPAEALVLREEARAMLGPDDEPLPPIVGFDALFIPDSYEQVTLIAPQLAFHEVSGVRLLGSAGWNHPDLVRIGRHHLNGAIFTETFYPDSEVPYVAEFTRGFEGAYGALPGSLAALSFDATNLVMAQLARGLRDRDRLRQALLDVRAYPGVSGITNMRSDGTAQKRPYLLGVAKRRIVALDD